MRTRAKALAPVESLNGTAGGVQHIRADHLRIDPDTQRALRPHWVRQIANVWDDGRVGVLHVSRRKDAFYVIDGQHRVFAARLAGHPEFLFECKVYNDLSKADEASIFNGLNTTKAVRAYDDFRVRLNYDADAQAIENLLHSVGLGISDQAEDGKVNAVAALESVYFGKIVKAKEATPWALAKALRTLTGAWGTNHDAVTGAMIQAAGALHLRYGQDVDDDLLIRKLAKADGGPVRVYSLGKTRREFTRETVYIAIANVMVDIYNKGRRKGALPAWK